MSLREQIVADIDTMLNLEEFGTRRTVKFDGNTYEDIPVVMTAVTDRRFQNYATVAVRKLSNDDHQQGTFPVTATLHCKASDLDGNIPEQGVKVQINDAEDSTYFETFLVALSKCEMGMAKLDLEYIDE